MSKTDHRGRSGRHSVRPAKPGKVGSIQGQFLALPRDLLESAACAEMSLAAHRVLYRICIEHMAHGGRENGKLPVTYDDFEAFGVRRASVAAAIRQLEALGLIEVTDRGRGGNAEFRRPSRFRVTFLSSGRANPTNEWASYAPRPISPRDIESRLENAPEPVGAKTRPENRSVRLENVSETRRENASGVLKNRRAADA